MSAGLRKRMIPPVCRFYPSCSNYAYEAVERYGTLQGGKLSIKRILRCHPLHPGGHDPIPDLTPSALPSVKQETLL